MMPHREWTAEDDALIRQCVAERSGFVWVAARVGRHRWTVRERARKLGLPIEDMLIPPQKRPQEGSRRSLKLDERDESSQTSDSEEKLKSGDDREPLPPGHELSWGAITAGTVLQGEGYRNDT